MIVKELLKLKMKNSQYSFKGGKMSDDSIYYYTNEDVLSSWINNKIIWATRSITSNDNKDTHYIMDLMIELLNKQEKPKYFCIIESQMEICKNINLRVLKDLIVNYNINNPEKFIKFAKEAYAFSKAEKYYTYDNSEIPRNQLLISNYAEKLIYEILKDLSSEEKKRLFDVKFEVTKEIFEAVVGSDFPYVICFTYEYDNRFLWDSYTNNKGVCLEFSKTELKEYLMKTYYKKNIDLYLDIIYEKKKQLEKMKEITMYPLCIGQFQQSGASFKAEFWKPEKEFRLIFGAKYFEDDRFVIKENYKKKYDNKHKTQDYIEIIIPENLVKSITIGPLCKINENDLFSRLKNSNINIKQSIGKDIINNS